MKRIKWQRIFIATIIFVVAIIWVLAALQVVANSFWYYEEISRAADLGQHPNQARLDAIYASRLEMQQSSNLFLRFAASSNWFVWVPLSIVAVVYIASFCYAIKLLHQQLKQSH